MVKNENPKKNKHLRPEDRREIEDCLSKGMTFKDIAKLIGKDPTTVSYEVKHHRTEYRNSFVTDDNACPLLLKAPFVCNGCPKRSFSSCHFLRYYYRAAPAQDAYRQLLTGAREGIPLNREEFYENDRIISKNLKRMHIYQIMKAHPEITCSKSSVYRYFRKGYLSASTIDLPRAVKFKARKSHREDYVPSGVKLGRTYDDFRSYLEENGLERYEELDTVIGRPGGKVIMTIQFTSCPFMIGLLMDNKTAAEGAIRFSSLKSLLRQAGISVPMLFDVLLCDNGGEFSDVFSFENDEDGNREIHLFFCDPMSPCQKPHIEKNHTLFRDIVPKGSSFDDFTQDTVNLIFSHINSVARPSCGGKTPYDLFTFLYGESVASLMGISRIDPDKVIQSPLLLKGIADLSKNL